MKKGEGQSSNPANPNNFELNAEQMSFIFLHYPEYSAAPYDMMTWLFGQAKQDEERYARPKVGGVATGAEELEEVVDLRPNPKGTGVGGAETKKQAKKKDDRDAQDKQAQQNKKKIEEIKKKREEQGKSVNEISATEQTVAKFKPMPIDKGTLQVVDTEREPCSMVFIGHVDAGKSTICGNLMFLNGVVDQRTI